MTMNPSTTTITNATKKSTEHTVFVRFAPPSSLLRRHHMENYFSQVGPIKKCSLIIPKKTDDGTTVKGASSYGFVKYTCESDAQEAAKELHKSQLKLPLSDQQDGEPKSFQVFCELASNQIQKQKENEDGNDNTKKLTTATTTKTINLEQKKKHNRVILRNLSFYAKESHIRQAMSQFGEVLEVHLPLVQNKSRGFAFCTFATPQQAQKAAKAAGNSTDNSQLQIKNRPVQIELSVSKQVHQKQLEEQNKLKRKQAFQETIRSRQRYEQEQQGGVNSDEDNSEKDGEQEKEKGDDDDSSSASSDDSEDDSKASDDDDEEEEEDDDDDDSIQERDDDDEMDIEKHNSAIQEQRQLFVRNLPFDATRHDVFEAFRSYGTIEAIYLVVDPNTKLPRGTAFVTYEKSTGAARAMKKASDIQIKARQLQIDFAVDKETAHTLSTKSAAEAAGMTQGGTKDKRNLYLKGVGRVDNEDDWSALSESDKNKRQRAWHDKVTKLKSPLFFINPHRLSIRNLSKAVDEAALKQLLLDATRKGLEKKLVSLNDLIAHWKAAGDLTSREILERSKAFQLNSIPEGENVLQASSMDDKNTKRTIPSVFLDRDYTASQTAGSASTKNNKTLAPSRGFAFAEFTYHTHALACLRELNNNPDYSEAFAAGGKAAAAAVSAASRRQKKKKKKRSTELGEDDTAVFLPRLIVEFTVENKAKAKQQAERRAYQQANKWKQKLITKERRELAANAGNDEEDPAKKKKSKRKGRGAKQREKKRQRRLQEQEQEGQEADSANPKRGESALEAAEARQRRFQQQEQQQEEKLKPVKPPKKLNKRQREDKQVDEDFTKLVDKYKVAFAGSALKTTLDTAAVEDPRQKALNEGGGKRWFD